MKSAIIVGAGQSNRFGQDKLSIDLWGATVLERSIDLFRGLCDQIIVVTATGQESWQGVEVVKGGNTRQQSVLAGLCVAKGEVVAIHDGARPFASKTLVATLLEQCTTFGCAIPFVDCKDTAYLDDKPIDRSKLKLVQTPQVFLKSQLLDCLENAHGQTDESTLYFEKFGSLNFVKGEQSNGKITTKEDLPIFKSGVGYDIHKFKTGRGITLGGVKIDCDKSFVAHSDGDVVLHALMDAILSCCNQKDIGHLFPNNDLTYLDVASSKLLKKVTDILQKMKGEVLSVSLAIIAQTPHLAPYVDQMKQTIASFLNVQPCHVGITATTAEGIGEIGQDKAVAVHAHVLCCFAR